MKIAILGGGSAKRSSRRHARRGAFIVEAHGRVRADPGNDVRFGFAKGSLYLFDPLDERALGRA
jgi:hypothetical protein